MDMAINLVIPAFIGLVVIDFLKVNTYKCLYKVATIGRNWQNIVKPQLIPHSNMR